MKYCVSGRQPTSVIKKADEIKIQFQDIEKIIDIIEEFPTKKVIYEIPSNIKEDDVQWDNLKVYSEKISLVLALGNLNLVNICANYNLKYYWAFPITSYYELKGVLDLKVSELFLGIPLCFDLKYCSQYNLPIRVVANLAYDAYIPRETGVNGFYIRPEDIKTYEQYVSSIEFITDELSKEATLLHVYTENKTWPGNLKLLITNLNSNVDNRGIPDDFGEARLNCQQKCIKNGSCHFCDTAMLFSNRIAKEAYERNNIIPN